MDASDPRHLVVRKLIEYWLEHPNAADTAEGICRWWLSDVTASEQLVNDALAWLAQRDVVVVREAADGRVRYRLSDEWDQSMLM